MPSTNASGSCAEDVLDAVVCAPSLCAGTVRVRQEGTRATPCAPHVAIHHAPCPPSRLPPLLRTYRMQPPLMCHACSPGTSHGRASAAARCSPRAAPCSEKCVALPPVHPKYVIHHVRAHCSLHAKVLAPCYGVTNERGFAGLRLHSSNDGEMYFVLHDMHFTPY